jgi:hypothetical protein
MEVAGVTPQTAGTSLTEGGSADHVEPSVLEDASLGEPDTLSYIFSVLDEDNAVLCVQVATDTAQALLTLTISSTFMEQVQKIINFADKVLFRKF